MTGKPPSFGRVWNMVALRRMARPWRREKSAASGGELPEAAAAAVRPRDAERRGRQESEIENQ